jgi:hypothetical protein
VRRAACFAWILPLAVAAAPGSAAAETPDPSDLPRADPPVTLALVAGAATAVIPLVLGAVHTASARMGTNGDRDIGYAVGGVGPALAPIVAHAVLGEWTRAAAFGAAPVAGEIAVCALVATKPTAIFNGTTLSRTGFALFYTLDIFGAAVGLFDVMMAHDRAGTGALRSAKRPLSIALAPSVGRDHVALVLGGSL